MEITPKPEAVPKWRTRGYPSAEFGAIEYGELKLMIYKLPGRIQWCATARPVFTELSLEALTFRNAQLEAIAQLKHHIIQLMFKTEIISAATGH